MTCSCGATPKLETIVVAKLRRGSLLKGCLVECVCGTKTKIFLMGSLRNANQCNDLAIQNWSGGYKAL